MKATKPVKSMFRNVGKLFLILGLTISQGRAETLTWTGGTEVWHEVENWTNWNNPSETRIPIDGDTAIVTQSNARVILSQTSAHLDALIINDATVSCSNWVTTLYATHLTIQEEGVLTCEGPFTNNVMSNRVNVVCETLLVKTDGAIQVDGKGYAGGSGSGYAPGQGPGGGNANSGNVFYRNPFFGASHGGAGRSGRVINGGTLGVPWFSYLATNTYGSAEAPLLPGSGGIGPSTATASNIGGSGGGAVRIDAVSVIIDGCISANGVKPTGTSHASAGSGGSVYITCDTVHGTNGTVSANAGPSGNLLGGGGGGGRIAVVYEPSVQSLLSVPSITFSVTPSQSGGQETKLPGDIGTLWFSDGRFFSPTNLFTGHWVSSDPGELTLSEWTVNNVWARLSVTNVTIENALTVSGTDPGQHKLEFACPVTVRCGQADVNEATLSVGGAFLAYTPTGRNPHPEDTEGSTLLCAGNLSLTNAAQLYVYAGLFRSGQPDWCGAQVDVTSNLMIATNCWIFPVAHPTNGAAPVFNMRNLIVAAGGGFDANVFGYSGGIGLCTTADAYGPGKPIAGVNSAATHGAGYGGAGTPGYLSKYGSYSYGNPGSVYGSANTPTAPGSGASAAYFGDGKYSGPYGGGSVQVRAERAVTLNGVVSANGGNGITTYGGGSSGGGIYITCKTFSGTSSTRLSANGGNGYNYGHSAGGGAGGGGRIAVWRIRDLSPTAVSHSVSGGLGWAPNSTITNAPAGSIVYGWIPEDATLIIIR